MKELVAQIKEQIAAFTENADLQVEKNNKAAGTRARKAALELSKLLKDFRKVSVEEIGSEPLSRAELSLRGGSAFLHPCRAFRRGPWRVRYRLLESGFYSVSGFQRLRRMSTWPLDLKATSSFSNRIFCSGQAGTVRP